MPNKKIKIAIISLTSCEGCEVAILDLGERLLEIFKNVETRHASSVQLIKSKDMMDEEVEKLEGCDIAFIEGSPTTARDIKLAQEVRRKAKKVIALGSCAHLGGVQKIKDYRGKKEIYKYVYGKSGNGENNDGGGINKYVKVDGVIPGCPIDKNEFLRAVLELLAGREFHIEENPVCYECLNNGYECLLQKGEVCLGPVVYAGCNAICLKSKQPCWGCRGFLPEASQSPVGDCGGETNCKLANFRAKLKEIASDKEVESVEEVFGLK